MGIGGGFIGRFQSPQPIDVYARIEGVDIIDLPLPVAFTGVTTGIVGLVGEFADMSAACTVDATGTVQSSLTPLAIASPADQIAKLGGPDWTLGQFGQAQGNGFVELRNKKFSQLVVQPVDLVRPVSGGGAQFGTRIWRQLPTNQSAASALPVVPVVGALVPAGYEFTAAGHRIRLAESVFFYADAPKLTGTDGSVALVGAAAEHQTFQSAGSNFLTSGVVVGDILVLGVIGAAGGMGANARTFRVEFVTDATHLELENLDGSVFDWSSQAGMPWRLYPARVADSAGVEGSPCSVTAVKGYTVLARPLDAVVVAATIAPPTVPPPAATATTCDPLSGLNLSTHFTGGLNYDAAVHAPNAANSVSMTGRYQAAIDALKTDTLPAGAINIVVSARKAAALRTYLPQHVRDCSAAGLTRTTPMSPEINTLTKASLLGTADPSPVPYRDERMDYCWPGLQTYIPEAVGVPILCADGTTTTTGILDVTSDTVLAALLSNLGPEFNPGQTEEPVPTVMAPFTGLQRGVTGLSLPDYIAFKAWGICAPRQDKASGTMIFQSGITASLTVGQTNINRRRMADYLEDTLAQIANGFSKSLATRSRADALLGEYDSWLGSLLSTINPSQARIAGYSLDDVSGNTPAMQAAEIDVILVAVQTLGTRDKIVLNCSIGQTVSVTAT